MPEDKPEAVVATMTFDKGDRAESDRLVRYLSVLSKQGMPIVAVDGGRLPRTEERLKKLGIRVVRQEAGRVGAAIHQAVMEAYDLSCDLSIGQIQYTEPVKECFLEMRKLGAPISQGRADIVFPSRDDASFSTFPANQQRTEGWFNLIASTRTGVDGDHTYGPKRFKRHISKHFDAFWDNYRKDDWTELLGPVYSAIHGGARATMVPIHGPCPKPERTETTEKDTRHRMAQATQNFEALLIGFNSYSQWKVQTFNERLCNMFNLK